MKLVINRKKIQEERIKRGMTIRQLASEANVAISTVNGILEGRKEPRVDCLAKVAKALGMNALDIATVEEGYNPDRKRPGPRRKNTTE